MIWSTPALQDATIYENDPYRNTGLDAIIEIGKYGDASTGNLSESRAVLLFDTDPIGKLLTEHNISITDITASLKLYVSQESELPTQYIIEAAPLMGSWENGTGYF